MRFINNQGVAAGYIATQSIRGPYLPMTYSGGQIQTFGVESRFFFYTTIGIDDRGVVVGILYDPNSNGTPYIYRNGAVEYPTGPAGSTSFGLGGITDAGTIYGSAYDSSTGVGEVFTLRDGIVDRFPISIPGFVDFGLEPRQLSDAGLLALTAYSEDYSVSQNFLLDIPTGTLSQVAAPTGYDLTTILQVTGSGLVFGQVSLADSSQSRYGFWNAEGSFRSFLEAPAGTSNIQINNLGQAIGINGGKPLLFDGTSWSETEVLGLNGYTFYRIDDFNDRGQFVGDALNPERNFLWGFVATPQQTQIPEPSSVALLALGLIGPLCGAGLRRCRQRSAR